MPAPIGLATAGPYVVLEGVEPKLLEFIAHLDRIHQQLFAAQLVITSGKDGVHSPGSLHPFRRAIDVRTTDKSPSDNTIFLVLLAHAAQVMPVTIFDERNLPGAPHIHIEWHGA